MPKRTHLLLVFASLVLAACQAPPANPVDIREQDACARCKMPISDLRYVGEVIGKAGAPLKFDDIGCLVGYVKSRQPKPDFRASYVMDYDTKQWVKTEEASFVRSEKIQTPMSSGMVAFRDKARAESVASQFQGQVLTFNDLLK